MKAPPTQPLPFSVPRTINLCLCDNAFFSFITYDPIYYTNTALKTETLAYWCFLGIHFCNSWAVGHYKPAECHSPAPRWSAAFSHYTDQDLRQRPSSKETIISVKNWIFQTVQHFACSKSFSHLFTLHLWMEAATNTGQCATESDQILLSHIAAEKPRYSVSVSSVRAASFCAVINHAGSKKVQGHLESSSPTTC